MSGKESRTKMTFTALGIGTWQFHRGWACTYQAVPKWILHVRYDTAYPGGRNPDVSATMRGNREVFFYNSYGYTTTSRLFSSLPRVREVSSRSATYPLRGQVHAALLFSRDTTRRSLYVYPPVSWSVCDSIKVHNSPKVPATARSLSIM